MANKADMIGLDTYTTMRGITIRYCILTKVEGEGRGEGGGIGARGIEGVHEGK